MNTAAGRAPARPFFLPATAGRLLCIYHPPQIGAADQDHARAGTPLCRGALVLVHAFAEEMNRSRRMFAVQARALADAGIAVLSVDLYGCGDSAGDFADARWEIWRDDLVLARKWLERQTGVTAGFLGLRLGALLALEAAVQGGGPLGPMIWWQPVLQGTTYLTQFLRLRQARMITVSGSGMTDSSISGSPSGRPEPPADSGTQGSSALRQQLQAGTPVEVAGYMLAPELAAAIDASDISRLALPDAPIHWFDLAAGPTTATPAARLRSAAALRALGARLDFSQVAGAAFWGTQEITEAPELVSATVALFRSPR